MVELRQLTHKEHHHKPRTPQMTECMWEHSDQQNNGDRGRCWTLVTEEVENRGEKGNGRTGEDNYWGSMWIH